MRIAGRTAKGGRGGTMVTLGLLMLGATASLAEEAPVLSAPAPRLLDIASPSEKTLLVLREGGLEERALPDLRLLGTTPMPLGVTALALTAKEALVTDGETDRVLVVDWRGHRTMRSIPVGFAPADVVAMPSGGRCFVANGGSGDVSVVDYGAGRELVRLRAGRRPKSMALSPDTTHLAVANLLAGPHRPDVPPTGEVTIIDTGRLRVVARVPLGGADMLRGIAWPERHLLLVTLMRPKNLLPLIAVAGGFTMTNGIALIDPFPGNGTPEEAKAVQLLLDGINRNFADPSAIALTPDGTSLLVTAEGADRLLRLDLASLRQAAAIDDPWLADRLDLASGFLSGVTETGADPVAVIAAGDAVLVANRLDGSVTMERKGRVSSKRLVAAQGGPLRHGERLFVNGSHTFHNQFSCRSCHPGEEADGLVYDIAPDGLGRNYVDTKPLLGVEGTSPFKWSGVSPNFQLHCGLRSAMFVQKSEGFRGKDLDDLTAFISRLALPRNRMRPRCGTLTPLQVRGKKIFHRTVDKTGRPIPRSNRCATCHPPPRYTNREAFDVGTRSRSDTRGAFDTPQLNNLARTAPYLHDGRALTLEEIWTRFNPDDRHGRVNDLSKDDLNALIEYLKTL